MVRAEGFVFLYFYFVYCGISVLLLFILSNLGLKVFGGVLGCGMEFVSLCKVLNFGVILLDW